MASPRFSLLVLLWLALAGRVVAQQEKRSEFPTESTQLLNRLRAIDKLNEAAKTPSTWWSALGQVAASTNPLALLASASPLLVDGNSMALWEKLLDEYTQLAIDADDALVLLPVQSPLWTRATTSLSLARICQRRILSLPGVVLAPYRQRIDAEAKRLLDAGRAQRDPEPLRRLVEERYCSSHTAEALDLLGDLAFEAGRFAEAAHWWGQLAPLPTQARRSLLLPEERGVSPAKPVLIQAKRILALAFQGDLPLAQCELEAFHLQYPNASAHLAGRDGKLSQTLREVIVDLAKAGPFTNADDSPTFAGNSARNHSLMQCPPSRLWEDGPTWRVKLPAARDANDDAGPPSRKTAYHPVIVRDLLILPDAFGITGYDLFSGRQRFRFSVKPREKTGSPTRFSVTVEGSRAYLRMGQSRIGPRVGEAPGGESNELVCVDFSDEKQPRVVWKADPLPSPHPTFFEGSPVVEGQRVYVAQSRVIDRRTQTLLVCYDRHGKVRWKREVCDSPEFEDSDTPRSTQHLLTWAGGRLVYASHAGAVVAVEPWTGQPIWSVRYPRRKRTLADAVSPREASPCLACGGRLFVAPQDSDHLLCVDGATGRVLWDYEASDVVHLLGVSGDRLVVATKRGLSALDAATGRALWTQPSDGVLPSLGRGLVAGGWIFWPTSDRKLPMRAVTLATGRQQKEARGNAFFAEPDFFDPTQLSPMPAGNFVFGQGCLAIAGVDELAVFVPADKVPPAPPAPNLPGAVFEQRYRVLQTSAAAGRHREAIAQGLALLDATRQTPHAALWRDLLETRLMPLVDPDLPEALLAKLPARLRAQVWRLRIEAAEARGATDEAATLRRVLQGDHAAAMAWLPDRTGFPRLATAPLPTPRNQAVDAGAPAASVQSEAALPYVLAWQHEADAWLPIHRYDGTRDDRELFTYQASALVCRGVADGTMRWRCELPFTPTWLGRHAGAVLVAGPDAVRALDARDGALLWHFPSPSRFHAAFTFVKHQPRRIEISTGFVGFRLGERTLTICDDQRRFFVLDPVNGEIVAEHCAVGSEARPLDAGFFLPRWQVVGTSILAQSAAGNVLWLDPQQPRTEPVAPAWSDDPPVLGDLVFVPSARGTLQAVERGSRRVRWTYTADSMRSLTGAALEPFGDAAVLLVLTPRNLGHELVRLDPATGNVLWRLPPGQLREGLATKCLDGKMLFHVAGTQLLARSLADGAVVWKRNLPSGNAWNLVALSNTLIVAPADGKREREGACLLLDAKSGQLLERIRLDASPIAAVGVQWQRLLTLGGGVLTGFGPQPGNNP